MSLLQKDQYSAYWGVRTGPMMQLLKTETPPLGWTNYCARNAADQAIWEERGDASTKGMLLLYEI